jgi:hexosaminidase
MNVSFGQQSIFNSIYIDIDNYDSDLVSIPIDEAYKIEISSNNIHLIAKNELGALYGLRTILFICLTHSNYIPPGEIIDYPSTPIRMFNLDAGKKFYSKDFIINLVKQMS